MTCFSGDVLRVANTRIFARTTLQGTQFLVYQMEYAAAQDLAMILPLPTPPNSSPDAVRFIDLANYTEFFSDMANGFPIARSAPAPSVTEGAEALPVLNLGSYEASFMPTLADLDRLEERFRIPEDVWKHFPEYHDYGFAVFQLRAEAQTVHPIGFEFATRNPNLLFFPTVHIHHREVPADSYFDHDLYCQARAGWMRSYDFARSFMDTQRAQGIVDPDQRIERLTVLGIHPNSDIVLNLPP
jgi:hypothetical protein